MRWLSGEVFLDEKWVPLMPDSTDPGVDLKDCNFLLLPYSNRIRDGRFSFNAELYQLEDADRHAIHGALRNQAWVVNDATNSTLNACCHSQDSHSFNWPWPVTVNCKLQAIENRIVCHLEVTNLGKTDMPIGGGWHPYFVRRLKTAEPRLSVPVSGVYPDTNGDCLPTGAAITIPEQLVFNPSTELSPDQRIDHCFAGLRGPLQIHWPDVDVTLTMSGSANYTHAVLYNPDKPYFALEPVTHANDAVNLQHQGIDAGLETLPPNETWQATLELALS